MEKKLIFGKYTKVVVTKIYERITSFIIELVWVTTQK